MTGTLYWTKTRYDIQTKKFSGMLQYEGTAVKIHGFRKYADKVVPEQLAIERQAGRVFKGWKEGKIYFAPTYKYRQNSDSYVWETAKSKKKRRTPAWYRTSTAFYLKIQACQSSDAS